MINLPPIVPVTDARLGLALPEQVRLLGDAGFPLVLFRGASPDEDEWWQELEPALEAARGNGGWPAVAIEGSPALARRAVQAGFAPWGLYLTASQGGMSQVCPASSTFHLGRTMRGIDDWETIGPGFDHAGVGPFRTGESPRGLDLEELARGCSILKRKGIAPMAFGEGVAEHAQDCFRAGAEALLLDTGLRPPAEATEFLWEAQCARWRFHPPLRAGRGVVLAGGSGCGKSTLARALARRLGLPARDLDEIVVRRTGKSISRIFAEDGEPAFRALEAEAAREAFSSPAVLALGGGAWESGTVRREAQEAEVDVLWIAEDPRVAWERVAQDPARPLSREREIFLSRWSARVPRWMEASMILPLGRTPEQLASELGRAPHR